MANPKCRVCGKTLKKKDAFVVKVNGKNQYYCNEQEYNDYMAALKSEADFYEEVQYVFDINFCFSNEYSFKRIKQSIKQLLTEYTREQILWFLNNNAAMMNRALDKKEPFPSEYNRVSYVLAIIKNNIRDYLINHPVPYKPAAPVEVNYYMPTVIKYRPSNKRRAMIDIENLGGD